jgi:glucan 1,3-beta-glucosidase
MDLLQDFHLRSYKRLRPIIPDQYIVMHDGFRLDQWESFFTKNKFEKVILDTHMYQCFDDRQRKFTVKEHLKATKKRKKILQNIERFVPVVVGEWSLGLSRNEHITDDNHDEVMKQYASAQLQAMRYCKGHVFWAYRVKQEFSGWHFRDLVDRGIIQMEEFIK